MLWHNGSILFKRRIRADCISSVRTRCIPYKLSQHDGPNLRILHFDHLYPFLQAAMEEFAPSRCAQILYLIGACITSDKPALLLVTQNIPRDGLHLPTLATGYGH